MKSNITIFIKSTLNIKLKTNNDNKSIFFKNKNTKKVFYTSTPNSAIHPQPRRGWCDEQLPFNLLYNLGLYVSVVIMTDNPVVRVILARNCIIGDNNVGCMRV